MMMKKTLKFVLMITICLYAALMLTGCAALFDALNFNRQPLPQLPSEPDSDLVQKNTRADQPMSKSEFDQLVTPLINDRSYYEDELTIKFVTSGFYGYADYVYAVTASAIPKSATINKVDDPEYDPLMNAPYATYNQRFGESDFKKTVYLMDDYFTASEGGGAYEQRLPYRFLIDEYIDDIPFDALDVINSGGIVPAFVDIILNHYVSAYSDYSNGKEITLIELDESALGKFLKMLPENFAFDGLYGKFIELSSVEMSVNLDRISELKLTLDYENGSVTLGLVSNVITKLHVFYSNEIITRPSYAFALKYLTDLYDANNDAFNVNVPEYGANVEYNSASGDFWGMGSSGKFSLYNTANPVFQARNSYYTSPFIQSIDINQQLIHYINFYSQLYIYEQSGDSVTQLHYTQNNYEQRQSQFYEMLSFFKIAMTLNSNSQEQLNIKLTNNTYTITITQDHSQEQNQSQVQDQHQEQNQSQVQDQSQVQNQSQVQDQKQDQSQVRDQTQSKFKSPQSPEQEQPINKREKEGISDGYIRTIKISKDFKRVLEVEYEIYVEGERYESLSIKFDYETKLTIPTAVTEDPYYK